MYISDPWKHLQMPNIQTQQQTSSFIVVWIETFCQWISATGNPTPPPLLPQLCALDSPRDLSPPEPSPAVWALPLTDCRAARLHPCPCTCPGPFCRAKPWCSQHAGQQRILHDGVSLSTGAHCRRGGEGYLKANRGKNISNQKKKSQLLSRKHALELKGWTHPTQCVFFHSHEYWHLHQNYAWTHMELCRKLLKLTELKKNFEV